MNNPSPPHEMNSAASATPLHSLLCVMDESGENNRKLHRKIRADATSRAVNIIGNLVIFLVAINTVRFSSCLLT